MRHKTQTHDTSDNTLSTQRKRDERAILVRICFVWIQRKTRFLKIVHSFQRNENRYNLRKSYFECKLFKVIASCNTVKIEIERSECAAKWNLRSGNNVLEFVYEFAVTSHIVADDDRNFVYTCAPSCEQQNNIAHCVKRHLIGISQKQRTVFSLVNIYLACKCFNLSSFIFFHHSLCCRRIHVAIIKYNLHCVKRIVIEFVHCIRVARKYIKYRQNWFDSQYFDRVTDSACSHYSIQYSHSFITFSFLIGAIEVWLNSFSSDSRRNNINTPNHTTQISHTHISNNGTKTTYAYCKWKGKQMGHDERQRSQIIGKLKRVYVLQQTIPLRIDLPVFASMLSPNGK